MNPLRMFVAVEISPQLRSAAKRLIERLGAAQASVKWVEAENLHFTLKFLGDVPGEQMNDVCRAVDRAVSPLTPFELVARGCGAFPSIQKPRTIWLGVESGSEPMSTLAEAIEQSLMPLGFAPEHRRFTPHLTLGRVREGSPLALQQLAELLTKYGDLDAGSTTIDEVTVFSSTLRRGGPKYEALSHAELRG